MRRFGTALLLLVVATTLVAQRSTPAGVSAAPAPATVARLDPGPSPGGRGLPLLSPDSAWWVPLSSTLLPGLGQIRLGQNRFVAYMAVEAYAILGWASSLRESKRETDRFHSLSWNVSRAFFEGRSGEGEWEYYEAMMKYIESGVYDRGGGNGLAPETDLETYNGTIWLKARELSHWDDANIEPPHTSAEYQAAIQYYDRHSVHPELRWSWRNAQLEWDDYRQSIIRKNDASRDASHYLGVVAVNHLLSTIDAFVTLRLRGGLGAPKGVYRLTGSLPLSTLRAPPGKRRK